MSQLHTPSHTTRSAQRSSPSHRVNSGRNTAALPLSGHLQNHLQSLGLGLCADQHPAPTTTARTTAGRTQPTRHRQLLNASLTAHPQRGMSMMSVLLGLVIAGLLAVVIFNQFTDSQRKARIEAATSEITTIIADAQKTYGVSNQYPNVTTTIAVQGGVIPARLRDGPAATTAHNYYNSPLTLEVGGIAATGDALTLSYGGVRQSDCQDLVLSIDPLVAAIDVNAVNVKPAGGAIALATLGAQCDTAAAVPVTFTFGRQ